MASRLRGRRGDRRQTGELAAFRAQIPESRLVTGRSTHGRLAQLVQSAWFTPRPGRGRISQNTRQNKGFIHFSRVRFFDPYTGFEDPNVHVNMHVSKWGRGCGFSPLCIARIETQHRSFETLAAPHSQDASCPPCPTWSSVSTQPPKAPPPTA